MRQTDNYIAPEVHVCDMEPEGVLCSSTDNVDQAFDSLQDYNPSEGIW